MNPLAHIRIGLVIALACLVAYGIYAIPEHYREKGRDEVRTEYEKQSQIAINKRLIENAQLAFEYQAKSREIVREYESQLNEQKNDYDKRIAIINKSGGLRIKSSCDSTAREATTTSTKGTNEDATTRLPERIESGLYELTRTCQRVETQLSRLQKWIIENGVFKIGKAKFHKDIAEDPKKVIGGGWWHLTKDRKHLYLYGVSTDFGGIGDNQAIIDALENTDDDYLYTIDRLIDLGVEHIYRSYYPKVVDVLVDNVELIFKREKK